MDRNDRFLKCAKALGYDVASAKDALARLGETSFHVDESAPSIAFPLASTEAVRARASEAELGVSVNVLEQPEPGSFYLREVAVDAL